MFLCDAAKEEIFGRKPPALSRWNELTQHRKKFTWPDRPVLFDFLEQYFKAAGYTSPLMYMHNSPGLLRVKKTSKKKVNRIKIKFNYISDG